MALQQTPVTETHRDLLRILFILGGAAAILALVLVLGAVFGVQDAAPTYLNVPDPAGIQLPF